MKKHIPYMVAFGWMIAVAVLAFLDGLAWSGERTRSAYLDGCAQGDRTGPPWRKTPGHGIRLYSSMIRAE